MKRPRRMHSDGGALLSFQLLPVHRATTFGAGALITQNLQVSRTPAVAALEQVADRTHTAHHAVTTKEPLHSHPPPSSCSHRLVDLNPFCRCHRSCYKFWYPPAAHHGSRYTHCPAHDHAHCSPVHCRDIQGRRSFLSRCSWYTSARTECSSTSPPLSLFLRLPVHCMTHRHIRYACHSH